MTDLMIIDDPPPTNRQEIEARAQAQLAPCKCGRKPSVGFISHPVYRRQIEAIIIRCTCGRAFREPIDYDETAAEVYPSAYEKAMKALWHWAMIQKHDLDGNATASLDRKIAEAEARKIKLCCWCAPLLERGQAIASCVHDNRDSALREYQPVLLRKALAEKRLTD